VVRPPRRCADVRYLHKADLGTALAFAAG
jgi:hypothetical protein